MILAKSLSNILILGAGLLSVHAIQVLNVTNLGPDPQTVNRLNGESFQQDALVSFNGFQYGVLWVATPSNASVRHAGVRRRALPDGDWEGFEFTDYAQTDDDGHDMYVLDPCNFS